MPSKPVLSEKDRAQIQQKLQVLCEQLWVSQGYKKTSIKQLCTHAGIAIGTFYSLFSTKENLFFETVKAIQTRLTEEFLRTVLQGANKESLQGALKKLFREFDSKPFLYDVNTPDFKAFVTKLPNEAMEAMKFESVAFLKEVCRAAHLKPKVDETKACAVLSALLATVSTKQTICTLCDSFEVFDFMADKLVAELFE